jgi:hypothetical protein
VSLPFETLTFPFVKGVNTKADPRALQPPGLVVCENAVFDKVGSIQKRNGFDALALDNADGSGSLTRRRGLGTRRDELLMFAEGRAFSWSDNDSEWQDRGRFESVLVDQKHVFHDRTDQVDADRAEASGVVLYAWVDRQAALVRWRAVDKSTGAAFTSSAAPVGGASTTRPKCRKVGSNLHLYYVEGNNLKLHVIDPTDIYGTLAVSPSNVGTTVDTHYDVAVGGNSAYVAWNSTTSTRYTVVIVSDIGNVTTLAHKAYDADDGISIAYEGNHDRLSIGRIEDNSNDYVHQDWLVASTLADATMDNDVQAESDGLIHSITTVAFQDGASYQAYVIWDVEGSDRRNDQLKRATVDSSGTVTVKMLLRHALLGSRAVVWTDGGVERVLVHALYGYSSSIQTAYFLLDANFVVGNDDAAQAAGVRVAGEEVGLLARLLPTTATDDTFFANLPQIEYVGGSSFACTLINRQRLVAEDALGDPVYVHTERGIVDELYTFADSRAYRGVEEGDSLYLPGGYVAVYDGNKMTESEFFLFPELEDGDLVGGTSGSLQTNAVYSYIGLWERKMANGERQISGWIGVAQDSTGVNTKFTITVPTLGATNDDNIQLALYRTIANPGKDAQYYRVTSFNPSDVNFVQNDPNSDTVSFSDGLSDASILLQEPFPYNITPLGSPVDGFAPPPTKYIAAGQDRLFTIDPQDPDRVWFSKLRFAGEGVHFSDAFSLDVPQAGGRVVAVDITDSGVLIFKKTAIYYVAGQGPDNLGAGFYGVPQPVSHSIGCKDAASVTRIHNGVLFSSEKGIYLIDTALQLHFVGAGVEDLLTDTIKGAIDVPDKHHALFLGDSTAIFMYDYLINEWSTWPAHFGESLVRWNGSPVYLHSTSPMKQHALFQDTETELGDDFGNPVGYSLKVETGWIRLKDLPNYHKVLWYEILTRWKDYHALEVKVAYDLDDGSTPWTDTWQWSHPAEVEVDGARASFIYRFTQMKTPAVRFSIRDTIDGLTGNPHRESMVLNHIAVKLAVKDKLGGIGTTITGSATGTIVDPG